MGTMTLHVFTAQGLQTLTFWICYYDDIMCTQNNHWTQEQLLDTVASWRWWPPPPSLSLSLSPSLPLLSLILFSLCSSANKHQSRPSIMCTHNVAVFSTDSRGPHQRATASRQQRERLRACNGDEKEEKAWVPLPDEPGWNLTAYVYTAIIREAYDVRYLKYKGARPDM